MTTPRKGYVGWLLPEMDRARLLVMVPPAYPKVFAHHVTLAFGVSEADPLPEAETGVVVGVTDDGKGIQALVVEIEGVVRRPGGGTYHITWSLDPDRGYSPKMSNDAIRDRGWNPLPRTTIKLTPQFFPF